MLISRHWLQTYFEKPLPDMAAIADALTFHAFEIDGIEKHGDDDVLDVKITADRGHDCLSHRGIAKEISAILRLPLKHDPLAKKLSLDPTADDLMITIEDAKLCSRYIAARVTGVKVGPSPQWLVDRLASMGQRSINNIVDATNFVMFDLGQPLHAFDASLMSKHIFVRPLREGEQLDLLKITKGVKGGEVANVARKIVQQGGQGMTVIADDLGPLALAGVKGGERAAISEATTDLIIESANFNGVAVRKAAKSMNIRTDSSSRFEHELSPELAGYAIRAVSDLIVEIAGGKCEGFLDAYPVPKPLASVSVETSRINVVLGSDLSTETTIDALSRLGFTVVKQGEQLVATVPPERLDITIPEDLIEEVARIVGFDAIEARELPRLARAPAVNKRFYWSEKMREFLAERGFSEILTSAFSKQGVQEIANKVDSDRPFLRTSLLPEMNIALQKNALMLDLLNIPDVRLFEIGTIFEKQGERVLLSIGTRGGKKTPKALEVLSEMCAVFGVSVPQTMSAEGRIEIDLGAWTETLSQLETYENLPTSTAAQYRPFSKYPYMVRDIAAWIPEGTPEETMREVVEAQGTDLLVRCDQFDRFQKEGRTSLAFRLVFQSFDRTLTDEEVGAIMDKIYAALRKRGCEIR